MLLAFHSSAHSTRIGEHPRLRHSTRKSSGVTLIRFNSTPVSHKPATALRSPRSPTHSIQASANQTASGEGPEPAARAALWPWSVRSHPALLFLLFVSPTTFH